MVETRRTAALKLLEKEEPLPLVKQPEVDKPANLKNKQTKVEQ